MATRGVRYVRPEERWDYIASVYANKMLIESTSEDAVDVISPAHLLQWILSKVHSVLKKPVRLLLMVYCVQEVI